MIQEQLGGHETFWNSIEGDSHVPVAKDLSGESIVWMFQEENSFNGSFI